MEQTRTAVVTGTSGELGQAVAKRLEADGYHVLVTDGAELPSGFSSVDVLVLTHVVADEPNWLECAPQEWTRLRSRGLDSMFCLLQTYANARIAIKAEGSVVVCTTDRSHAEDGSDVLRSTISWGVRGLVRNAAAAYARKGVRINGVCVGAEGVSGQDVATLVAFLDQGAHITGQTIPVAGGRTLL